MKKKILYQIINWGKRTLEGLEENPGIFSFGKLDHFLEVLVSGL